MTNAAVIELDSKGRAERMTGVELPNFPKFSQIQEETKLSRITAC